MKTFLKSLIALLLLTTGAIAQSVQQSGTVSPGHPTKWVTTGVIGDAGTSTNGSLTTLGLTANNGCVLGINDGPILSGYHELCLGFSNGTGVISYQNYGGAAATPLDLVINGTTYGIGGTNWLSAIIDSQMCPTQGSVLYRSATVWTCLTPGSSGQVLQTQGPNANPTWASGGGTGTVTSITAGTGLTGGTITSSGTIALDTPVSVAHGGTGASTISAHGVVIGNGTSAINAVTPGISGTVLQSNGVSADPTWNVVAGTGTVTSITAADGTITVSPTPLVTSGTIAVATNGVANANLAQMGANTIKGNNTGSTANAADLTVSQVISMLSLAPPIPQGRLTLVTGAPVMTANETAQSTVYYDCYNGNVVPYYTGSAIASLTITSCEVSMGLDSVTPHITSGSLYDIFAVNSSGLVICAGPAWTNSTTRSSAIHNTKGFWTNTSSLTHCYGGASGTTDYGSVSADQGTYLGTLYATANGQTAMNMVPSPASGGGGNVLGLYNAYNRVTIQAASYDSTANWTYTTNTVRAANAGGTGSGLLNRISWIDGLQQSSVAATYSCAGTVSSVTETIGIGFDSVTAFAANSTQGISNSTSTIKMAATGTSLPLLGFHYVQALENTTGSTATFYGSGYQVLTASVEM